MARFRATIQGNRGMASRLGHHHIEATVNGWQAGIRVSAEPCQTCNNGDLFEAYVTSGSGSMTQWANILLNSILFQR